MAALEPNMDWKEPQWLVLAGTALAAFIGWRSKEAVEAIKTKRTEEDVKEIKSRLLAVERVIGTHAPGDHRALEDIHAALARIEGRIDGKVDK